ncbi:hypothetical protein ACQ4PT_005188 [Festuca glaucescens]
MDLRSARRLRRSSPPPHGSSSQLTDRNSALPDEMLLLILAHLCCVRTAVQSSLLSRRWRDLWTGLTDLTFRGLKPSRIQALFRRFAASPQVSTLDIDISSGHTIADANSLLGVAAHLSPRHLFLTLRESYAYGYLSPRYSIDLPCFHGTSTIEIDSRHFDVRPLPTGEFTALESLSVAGNIVNLGSLLNRCPRLRVLSLSYPDWYTIPITMPPVIEFPMLEKLSLSGMIANLEILLNQCPRLRVLNVSLRKMRLSSIKEALTILEKAGQRGLMSPILGIEIPWRDDITPRRFAYLLRIVARI